MAEDKLTVAGVFHHFIDRLGLHDDTAKGLHQVVDDNLASEDELAQRERNPWAQKSDAEVIEAAIAGDKDAAAEYRERKDRQAAAAAAATDAPPASGT